MKKILFKSFLCIMALAMCLVSVVSCGEDPIENPNAMTEEKALTIISKTALDYTGLELDPVEPIDEVSVKKVASFLEVDKSTFTKMVDVSLDENEILSDSKVLFDTAVSAAYLAIKNYDEFTFGKVYDVNFVNKNGDLLESKDCPAVAIIDAKDGGIFVLYYSDSSINNETVQVAFYLTLYGETSVVKSMAIYAGANEEEKGVLITDYVQYVQDKSIESASIVFELESGEEARTAGKIINRKSKTMKEVKENTKTIEYGFAEYSDEEWTSKFISIEKEDAWTDFMQSAYTAMTNNINLYGSDFEALFAEENVIEVKIVEGGSAESDTDPVAPDTDDTTESGTVVPETDAPADTTTPESTTPDTTVPEDTNSPETTAPETQAPAETEPSTDTTAPETTAPADTTTPETSAPETTTPADTTAPESTTPDTTVPEETTAPAETQAPADTTASETEAVTEETTSTPDTTAPSTTV